MMCTQKNKKIASIASIIMYYLVVHLLWTTPVAHAQFTTSASEGNPLFTVISVISLINTFLQIIIFIVLWILQFLLSAQWFTNGNMMSALHSIWMLSRDIMNIFFALMFIGMALWTIVTADKSFVTGKIRHFLLAVILINFSWFFPRVILDVANVLTATIYSIPNMLPADLQCREIAGTLEEFNANPKGKACESIVDVRLLPNAQMKTDFEQGKDTCNGVVDDSCNCNTLIACYKIGTYQEAKSKFGAAHATINGLAVSFIKFHQLQRVPEAGAAPGTAIGGITGATQAAIAVFATFMIQAFLLLPLIGLAIGLLIRIMILWITIAFMPFAFLGYAINGSMGSGISALGIEDYVWKNFISAAFLPVAVAIPLVVGMVMLSAVSQIPPITSGMTFAVPLIFGVKSWWGIMWIIVAVIIMYEGAFAALKKNTIVGTAVGGLQQAGEQLGGAIKRIPGIVPLPIPGIPGATVSQLYNAPRDLNYKTQQLSNSSLSIFNTELEKNQGKNIAPGIDSAELGKHIGETIALQNKMNTHLDAYRMAATKDAQVTALTELTKTLKEAKNIANIANINESNVLATIRAASEKQGLSNLTAKIDTSMQATKN